MRLRGVIAAVIAAAGVSSSIYGQEEDEEPFSPGLIARYESSKLHERIDRSISFHWDQHANEGSANAANSAGDRLRVQWRGRLLTQGIGKYQLHAYVSGQLKIVLNGTAVLTANSSSKTPQWFSTAPMELAYDYHPLFVEYEKGKGAGHVVLYWSGPQFQLEPIDGRQLFHDRGTSPDSAFDRGATLVRALRCAACHELADQSAPIQAPSLARLAGAMNPDWMQAWLLEHSGEAAEIPTRRMPYFSMTKDEAREITSWLHSKSLKIPPMPDKPRKKEPPAAKNKGKKKSEPETPPKSPVDAGRELFLSMGCLACHQLGELGTRGLFDGGDLTAIAGKRPPGRFFEQWLSSPEALNPQHRMPVFELTDAERKNLSEFLQTLGSKHEQADATFRPVASARGEELIRRHRCTSCHVVRENERGELPRTRITADSNWSKSCVANARNERQPHYELSESDKSAIQKYLGQSHDTLSVTSNEHQLLVENNCLACHQRNEAPGLAPQLTKFGEAHSELAPQIPAMTPPALNSVGDKLHDVALRNAIARNGPPHRDYLMVRMPRFKFSDAELKTLVDYFVVHDRIPENPPSSSGSENARVDPTLLEAIGQRLVTPDGFGCTSCHQIGRVLPVKAPLNARGPDISMLGQRLRRTWFDRFVRNPSRIVPRMEMPSVQVAVRGVQPNSLDQQLGAVWEILNKPGFQPPEPNAVRVVRHTGTNPSNPAVFVTEVLRNGDDNYIKPLLIGLSNRHNALFDLETARLVNWSIGDTARQRTEGKTWFWEMGGKEIFLPKINESEISLLRSEVIETPDLSGQFITEFDSLEHIGNGLRVGYRLHFSDSRRVVPISQTFVPLVDTHGSGFRRVIEVAGLEPQDRLRLAVFDKSAFSRAERSGDGRSFRVMVPLPVSISLRQPTTAVWDATGISAEPMNGHVKLDLQYLTTLPVDHYPIEAPPQPSIQSETLKVVPGFTALRLPLSDDIMPTALSWRPNGSLVVASLKGQVFEVKDSDRDGVPDQLLQIADGFAAPYGLHATADYVDVVNKYAVLRLFDKDRDGRADRVATIASGWGHTADYHDWAVGLPRDEEGNYFIALPCQQDQRSPAAAYLRGHFLKLVPRQPTAEDPRGFSMETISQGHRFPMGIARRRDAQLFVTDNQGNYNPFNELNHIRANAHFGFINALEKVSDSRPPLTPPAINLPHPWVRSVNGICFLETPAAVRQSQQRTVFGPFEGHLIGCEYDTRRLIRMSVQQVGDTFQGAAYPFSYDQPKDGPPFLGPIVCEVSPGGDLYVGGLRDSGWGGANNIGEIVRLQAQPGQIPCGIAEMRAVPDGFELTFTAPVDRQLAAVSANYSLASYTRESTPAYGGPDIDRRTEQIQSVEVAQDGQRATLRLSEMRVGYVYELHLKKLLPGPIEFFPAEAHFTLLKVPEVVKH